MLPKIARTTKVTTRAEARTSILSFMACSSSFSLSLVHVESLRRSESSQRTRASAELESPAFHSRLQSCHRRALRQRPEAMGCRFEVPTRSLACFCSRCSSWFSSHTRRAHRRRRSYRAAPMAHVRYPGVCTRRTPSDHKPLVRLAVRDFDRVKMGDAVLVQKATPKSGTSLHHAHASRFDFPLEPIAQRCGGVARRNRKRLHGISVLPIVSLGHRLLPFARPTSVSMAARS